MQDLIEKITGAAGMDAAKAEQAVGILLNLVKTQGNKAMMPELFSKMPGAAEIVSKHGGDGAGGGGFMGMLAGGLMGGPLAMITKLQAAGLTTDQMKIVGTLTMDYAKEKVGHKEMKLMAGNIPGLAIYI
jgi:hypothetical protein